MAGPLQGLRVLDLSRVLAGPWSTQTLADLGAEVIKVERPGVGDDTRGWGPPFMRDANGNESTDAAYYHAANRGKKSIAVDFHKPEGQDILRKLAAVSDILVENYKVGTLAHYGLDYESLKAVNPGIIYCSITAFGQTGPYHARPGYDFLLQAMGGLMSVTGAPDGDPMKVGVAVTDLFTGLYASTGILAALAHRQKTGQGQHIDLALLDSQVAMLSNLAMYYLASGHNPPRLGNQHTAIVPYNALPTSDGYIVITVGNDGQFAHLAASAGKPELARDARFATNADRVRHRDTLMPLLREILQTRTTAQWMKDLEAGGVPCAPVNRLDQVFADPQVQSRQTVVHLPHPSLGNVPGVANPIRMSETPAAYTHASPTLGQHTGEVMRDILSASDADIARLREARVIE